MKALFSRILCSILSVLLVVEFAALPLLYPREAKAIVPTWDTALNGIDVGNPLKFEWQWCKEASSIGFGCALQAVSQQFSLDALAWMFAKAILHDFAQRIVHWIQTGQDPFFSKGTSGSLFVTDIDDFLLDAADNAAGIFVEEYFGDDTMRFLCSPFRLQIGIGIARGYGRDFGSFMPKARCTITDIVENVEDFYQNFENGGWDAFVKMGSYANTPYGLLTLSLEESYTRQTRRYSANLYDFLGGLGFPGLRECVKQTPEGKCEKYITKTPGKAIEDQVEHVLGFELDKLGAADEINEILAAVFSQLISWVLTGGGDEGLLGTDPGGGGGGSCSDSSGRETGCSCSNDSQCQSGNCQSICLPPSVGPAECADGADNDGDGLTDLSDPDCSGSQDDDESGGVIPPPPGLPPSGP